MVNRISLSLFAAFLAKKAVSQQCNVCCCSVDAYMTNLNAIITFPEDAGLPISEASCGQIYNAGLNGLLGDSGCEAAEEYQDVLIETCGCTDPNPPPTTPTPSTPTPTGTPAAALPTLPPEPTVSPAPTIFYDVLGTLSPTPSKAFSATSTVAALLATSVLLLWRMIDFL
jgi:hypothetical protein